MATVLGEKPECSTHEKKQSQPRQSQELKSHEEIRITNVIHQNL